VQEHATLEGLTPSDEPPAYIPPALGGRPGESPPPPLNVVIHVVGSRGDVQPFVALGQTLKNDYGHRVRLATHPVFKSFVEENGLEFFSIGGDPAELMAFMVKHPGLMPGFKSLTRGEISRRRKDIFEIAEGCWRSCYETVDSSIATSDTDCEDDTAARPFVADAIIANPPSFAHIHCAEKLGVPLHMMFTYVSHPLSSWRWADYALPVCRGLQLRSSLTLLRTSNPRMWIATSQICSAMLWLKC